MIKLLLRVKARVTAIIDNGHKHPARLWHAGWRPLFISVIKWGVHSGVGYLRETDHLSRHKLKALVVESALRRRLSIWRKRPKEIYIKPLNLTIKILVLVLLVSAYWPQEKKIIYDVPVPVAIKEPVLKPIQPISADVPTKAPKEPMVAKKPAVAPARGNCASWMEQAGIPQTAATTKLILNESGCNPYAQNPTSSAYGIGQFLNSTWALVGCKKSSDPVYQLKCMDKYVRAVYGTWENALAKWYSRYPHWY